MVIPLIMHSPLAYHRTFPSYWNTVKPGRKSLSLTFKRNYNLLLRACVSVNTINIVIYTPSPLTNGHHCHLAPKLPSLKHYGITQKVLTTVRKKVERKAPFGTIKGRHTIMTPQTYVAILCLLCLLCTKAIK